MKFNALLVLVQFFVSLFVKDKEKSRTIAGYIIAVFMLICSIMFFVLALGGESFYWIFALLTFLASLLIFYTAD